MPRDLFGDPVPEKPRRRRTSGPERPSGAAPAFPAAPGLGDLVARLRPVHRRVEADLQRTLEGDPSIARRVERRCADLSHEQGVAISTGQYLHTAATVHVLKALFLRVAEDYGLFPGPARKVALRGEIWRALRDLAPRLSWSDYLEYALRDLAYLPVAYDLFKETAYEEVSPSDEVARGLLDTVAALPDLRAMDTRALGDLYEHLMEAEERKRLGYFTTPDFIIDFLLERTLEPAVREFGVHELRYLDPCCGTGHFLVRAYRRLDRHLQQEEPHLSPLARFERIVEDNLFGVDISEFAARITLFRLFLEGVRLAQAEGLEVARWGQDITFNVYTANSLVKPAGAQMPLFEPGRPPGRRPDPVARRYGRELTHLRVDLHEALARGFHVVNANPPYVRIHRQEAEVVAPANGEWRVVDFVSYLRESYKTAQGQFDLSVPFVERGLELLVPGGYLGYITSGKFAKQSYGKKLATERLAGTAFRLLFYADLTDAQVFEAGTYPALLIVQRPADGALVSGEASVEVLATYRPAGASGEENWAALRALLRQEEAFTDYAGHYRERQAHFRAHPWTVRRGPRDLLSKIRAACDKTLADYVDSIGEDFQTNADPVFCDYITESFIRRHRLERELCLPCLRGENIRNWTVTWHGNRKREQTYVLYTLDLETGKPVDLARYPNAYRYLLRYRRYLGSRTLGWGGTVAEEGLPWWTLNKRNARLGVAKISFPQTAMHSHPFYEEKTAYIVQQSAETAYMKDGLDEIVGRAVAGIVGSTIFTYFVSHTSGRVQRSYLRFLGKALEPFPVPSLDGNPDIHSVAAAVERLLRWHAAAESVHPRRVLREKEFGSPGALSPLLADCEKAYWEAVRLAQSNLNNLDHAVYDLYGLCPEEREELEQPMYKQAWRALDWQDEVQIEIRDYICDLIEALFAAQRAPQERPLSPGEIAGLLAREQKFEPLRAVYYGGKPVSAEQFVRECMDWDCRPIPFDEEAMLVGRKPKRVDVLHERFFRFDGVDRDLYGWTGWSPEAQANVFLTLAERAQDRTPFYRWVARLIALPEESPDIADPAVRAGLRALIGEAEPYPYVVMG